MEAKWFILALILLWLMWLATGGPARTENNNAPFLEEPAPINSGQPYTLKQLKDGTRP